MAPAYLLLAALLASIQGFNCLVSKIGVWLNDDPITTKIALGGLMVVGGVGIIQVREAVAACRKEIHEARV